jgi:hypothetical protein
MNLKKTLTFPFLITQNLFFFPFLSSSFFFPLLSSVFSPTATCGAHKAVKNLIDAQKRQGFNHLF